MRLSPVSVVLIGIATVLVAPALASLFSTAFSSLAALPAPKATVDGGIDAGDFQKVYSWLSSVVTNPDAMIALAALGAVLYAAAIAVELGGR
jgi:hypothetical protein